jgi:hypothetical protein
MQILKLNAPYVIFLSLSAEFGAHNMSSLALDAKLTHHTLFDANLANFIIDNDAEWLVPLYVNIPPELNSNVATSTLAWAVHFLASYASISHTGGCSDDNLSVLATTLNQDLPDYVGHYVESVPSPAGSPAAQAPRMTCLQIPTNNTFTRPSGTKGHL